MPDEKTLDDDMQDATDDEMPEIEISLFDDPDGRVADAGDDQEENRPPTA